MREKNFFQKLIKDNSTKKISPKWGLVLSGGGTKGAYEVGAWKALCELRIPINGISGTSIGALNAAMFLSCEMDLIESIYRNIKITDVLPVSEKVNPEKDVFDPANLLRITRDFFVQRGLDNAPLRNMLKKYLNLDMIYSSSLDLGIVTYNVKTREAFQLFKEDIERDKLIDYLLASANFPIYKTLNVDGKLFMDGGLYDNMPFNPLIERGYNHLIVVDINGVGMTRKMENADNVYLRMISCSENLGGTFEFNRDRIEKNLKLGYLDTMKAFHKLFGSYYFFRRAAFNELLVNFDMDTIWGLESAAKIYGMDRYRVYRADEFINKLEQLFNEADEKYLQESSGLRGLDVFNLGKKMNSHVRVAGLVHTFMENPASRGGAYASILPELVDAANAIIALKNYRKL